MTRLLLVPLLAALLAAGAPASATPAASAPGGSNYNFYGLNGCDREPFGVINRFDRGRDTITGQLGAMRRAGQQRLRIGVFHHRGPDTGTVMDSTGGDLSPANRRNLADLLAAVKAAGFAEVEVAFHPIGDSAPYNWAAFDEGRYQENWNLIHHLRPIIAGAGIPYRIDLMNEGAPAPNQPALRDYAKRLWTDYTHTHGKADTVGFSVIGDPARIGQLPAVYGDNQPYVFDLHFYEAEYAAFVAAHDAMNQLGYHQGWILGEAYYNDAVAAVDLRRASNATGRQVHYLTQWPLTRARTCPDVDVAPPADFGAYTAQGF
ncbi:hypothetical protein [Amycolatopsis anabasis]|uniref:hypothetical protein n=1 Tax=Amycolatopsis anabasis TaxID=1840409 RepID=UPI00131EBB39|nr:hypothetical protein [Amycolatopsis anabasis]